VYVNGKIVPEPYVPPQYEDLSDYGPMRVPKDNYFVMGIIASAPTIRAFSVRLPAGSFTAAPSCVLARGSFRLAFHHGSQHQVTGTF